METFWCLNPSAPYREVSTQIPLSPGGAEPSRGEPEAHGLYQANDAQTPRQAGKAHSQQLPRALPPPTPAPQIPPRVKGKEGKAKPDLAGYYF